MGVAFALVPALRAQASVWWGAEPGSRLVSGQGLAQAELQSAQRNAEICSSRNAPGVGLRGVYFAQANFKGEPLLSRVDATVDFTSTLDWPESLASSRPKSVRWTGWVRPPITGRYTFHATPAQARVSIGHQVLAGGSHPVVKPIELAAGRYYPVVLEVDNMQALGPEQQIRFEWTAPHGMRFVVPRALMFLPSDQVTP